MKVLRIIAAAGALLAADGCREADPVTKGEEAFFNEVSQQIDVSSGIDEQCRVARRWFADYVDLEDPEKLKNEDRRWHAAEIVQRFCLGYGGRCRVALDAFQDGETSRGNFQAIDYNCVPSDM